MKIAIAGPGELAQHVIPPLLAANHSVIVLTRSPKDWITSISPSIPQLITDYSDINQLTQYLNDHSIEVLISTLSIYDDSNVAIHLNLLGAAQASKACKRFIPSEYGGNVRDFPEQPMFYYPNHEPVRKAFREQSDVEYTLVCCTWFSEYILPACHPKRIFKDAGEAWVMDHANKVMRIYGNGKQDVSLFSASDLGTALAKLVEADKWEEYTFLSGEQLSWNELFERIRARDGEWKKRPVTLADSVGRALDGQKRGDEWSGIVGLFEVYGHTEATGYPRDEIARQKEKYFRGLRWKTVDDMLDEVVEA